MRKKFTFLLFAAVVFAVGANADDTLTFNWAHSVDGQTTGGDSGVGMAKASDDSGYFVCTTWGTSDTQGAKNVCVDGDTLRQHNSTVAVVGGSCTSTSNNANILLQKVDQSGNVLWYAYTKKGDFNWSYSDCVAAPDGGVVLVLKGRAWEKADGLNNLIELVDARGRSTTVNDPYTTKSEYRYIVAKLNGEGVLQWSRVIWGKIVLAGEKIDDSYDDPLKQNAKDVLDVYGTDIDNTGNIYIAGRFRTSMYIKKSDGSIVTLVAKNNKSFDGDSQQVMGDLFLIKLNANGFYENSLVSESTASLAFFDNVVHNDGKLYLNGRVKGDGTTYTLGDKTVNASTELQTMFLASINTSDLSVNWINTLTPSKGTKASTAVTQNKNAQYINGSVYFTGLLKGAWTKEGETTPFADSQANLYKGYVLKVDPETGAIQQSYVRTEGGIGGFFGVWVGGSNTYIHGYDMSSKAILVKIDNETFTKQDETVICTYGTTAICTPPLIDGENFIMMNRGGKANNYTNSATFYGTETKFENLACWGNVYYSYKINDATKTE